MILELEGELDENGMLLDFYEIDKIVLPLIKEYDHSLIVETNDTKIIEFLKENNFRHKTINYTSTSENLAINFCEQLKPEFSKYKNIKIIRVRVYETVDAYAEVTAKCNE
jgi:6-pyruvoyltetrahydropterin/6-carboxytetrahydropterin synthase